MTAAIPLAEVWRAQRRTRGVIHHTPLTHSSSLSKLTGTDLYLKCENLQRTGSFKIRGAFNRLAAMDEMERARGVVAASAGNHAQGVALAASLLGAPATIFMPESTPLAKVSATQGYGATVELVGLTFEEAQAAALNCVRRTGANYIHPFDDQLVMAGQATVALEILADLEEPDAIVVPVGGGGLIAGVAAAVRSLRPSVKIFGVESANAPCFLRSLEEGRRVELPAVTTIADGIAVHQPGELTFELVRDLVDGIVTVEEETISRAMVMLLERAKLTVEGAGAVGLAALLTGRLPLEGRRVVALLSGGNVDINLLARIIDHGLANAGRYLVIETWLPDRPGELIKVLEPLKEARANVLGIEHRRPVSFPEIAVLLTVETRDFAHGEQLLGALRERGYRVRRLELGSSDQP